MIFVIHGKTNKTHKELTKIIKKYGHKVHDHVSNLSNFKTDYLISNNINDNCRKNNDAKLYNIPIITEQELFNILKKEEL